MTAILHHGLVFIILNDDGHRCVERFVGVFRPRLRVAAAEEEKAGGAHAVYDARDEEDEAPLFLCATRGEHVDEERRDDRRGRADRVGYAVAEARVAARYVAEVDKEAGAENEPATTQANK